MDIVRLLDHYRTAATRDMLAFRILAQVYEQGTSREADVESAGAPVSEVRARLLDLYRSNLLRRTADLQWTTTELADLLLARTGVVESSTHWLIDTWGVPKEESAFLKSCIRSTARDDPKASLEKGRLIKTLSHVRSHLKDKEAHATDLDRALYAAVVGLDWRAETLGHSAFAEELIDRTPELEDASTPVLSRLKQIVKTAIKDAKKSDRMFVTGQPGRDKTSLALSWGRMLTAAASSFQQQTVACFAGAPAERVSHVWDLLKGWKPDLDEQSFDILVHIGHGLHEIPSDCTAIPTFVAVNISGASGVGIATQLAGTQGLRIFFSPRKGPAHVQIARYQLRKLSDSLVDGSFDELDVSTRQELCAEIDLVADAFRSRLAAGEVGGSSPERDRSRFGQT